jgi:hypothetical protein
MWRAAMATTQSGETVLGVTRCLPTSGRREASVDRTADIRQTLFLLGLNDAEKLRQKMALVRTDRRLLFLTVSLATAPDWTILRTIPIDFVIGVRPSRAADQQHDVHAEIVFADGSVFVARFAPCQRRMGRRFLHDLGVATSVIDRHIPI